MHSMNAHRLILPALFLTALQGCETSARAPQPVVTDSAGVEIATLEHMPSLLDPDYEWGLQVQREFRTQGAALDSEPLLFDPRAVLPLRDGRLLVLDPFADKPLVIVDVDQGEVLVRFSGKGQGPGELSWGPHSMWEGEDGALWVVDQGNLQIQRYSLDGELLSTQPYVTDGWPMGQAVQPQTGALYGEIFTPPTNRIDRLDVGSGEQVMVLDLPTLPYDGPADIRAGRALWTVLRSGIVTTRSDVAVFFFYSERGDLIREIRLPLSKRTITEMDIREQVAQHGDIARGLEVGPIAITNYLYAVDDSIFGTLQGDLWRAAEDPVPPEDQTIWRLISVTGEYMGFLPLPEGFLPLASGSGGVLWAKVPDENGAPIIQELALERP